MQYHLSNITQTRDRSGRLMVRFNLTTAENGVDVKAVDSAVVTTYGCIAGRTDIGPWAWPPQQPNRKYQPVKWSKGFENEVLWALEQAGVFGKKAKGKLYEGD